MKIKKHLNKLGLKVEDRITGFIGVVSSISFDLYGCVQGLVTPHVNEEVKTNGSRWLDLNRLRIINEKSVMELPNFDYGPAAEGKQGPAAKPVKDMEDYG